MARQLQTAHLVADGRLYHHPSTWQESQSLPPCPSVHHASHLGRLHHHAEQTLQLYELGLEAQLHGPAYTGLSPAKIK